MHLFSVPISRNKTGDSFAHNCYKIKVNKTAHFIFLSATIFCENCCICVSHHGKLFLVYNVANNPMSIIVFQSGDKMYVINCTGLYIIV